MAITNLLQHREIIFIPMPNANGYVRNKRQEQTLYKSTQRSLLVDPQEDFPFGTDANECLGTVTARSLYRLFVDNLFVTAISLHSSGRGTAVGYPWRTDSYATEDANGDPVADENPDFQAFTSLGQAMVEASGDGDEVVIDDDTGEAVVDDVTGEEVLEKYYALGSSLELFAYSLTGSLSDWAYGAGWDPSRPMATCSPLTEPTLEAAFFSNSTTEYIAAAFFQIETTKNGELTPPLASYGSRKKTSTRQERADGTTFTDY